MFFDFNGENESYKLNDRTTHEIPIKVNFGWFMGEYNTSTRELKLGIGKNSKKVEGDAGSETHVTILGGDTKKRK